MDAKGHKTDRLSDQFGRLRQVVEYSGTNPWSVYATTTYTYSVLDLLTQVADTAGNSTTGGYDSEGRKVIMTDPDMGAWRYGYDVNGNLITQTSPLTVTTFAYDALDRLTQQSYQGGGGYFYSYDGAGVPNGVGRRTAMGALGGPTQMSWQYDARGHVSQATYNNIAGLTTAGSVQWSYDSGNRLSQLTYPDGEQLSYSYDGAWRADSLYSSRTSSYLVGNATGTGVDYTALDQPLDRSLGNGWTQVWAYGSPMARLRGLQIGPTGAFSHTYAYDGVGNVSLLTNTLTSELQSFTYDHRDRLTTWTLNGASTSYAYSPLGNLTLKGSTSYTYGTQGSNGGPHAVISTTPGGSYSYDANGNMLSGGGRTYSWTPDNQPGSISSGGVTESYSYEGDNERLTRLRGGLTTVYLAGLQEEDVAGTGVVVTTRKLYPFAGQVVAELNGSTLYYLHGDQLGSVALVSGSAGSVVSQQDYDPWGAVRTSPAITQTTLNYTGQRLDGTGLLYYHARYYDPVLARWTSADSFVPGRAESSGGTLATIGSERSTNLTVDQHEIGLIGIGTAGSGPGNPQALNRYSYTLNNPVRYSDPTGHCLEVDDCTGVKARSSSPTWAGGDGGGGGGGGGGSFGNGGGEYVYSGALDGSWNSADVETQAQNIARANGVESIWDLLYSKADPNYSRGGSTYGDVVEDLLQRNLPRTFRTIDRFDPKTGIATSIKALNLARYGSVAGIRATLRGYINELAGFQGASLEGHVVNAADITLRELEVAIPTNATQAQLDVLEAMQEYAAERGIVLAYVTIP